MFRLLRISLLSGFLFVLSASAENIINVCLWKGNHPQTALPRFQEKYPGDIKVVRHGNEWLIISSLELEEYLEGVLAKEMDSLWPMEALKAQAVLARTFAINTMLSNRARKMPFDIENSIYDQVYGISQCQRIKEAVSDTKGMILTSGGNLHPVFFHSNCGGRTSAPHEVWGGNYPAITSVNCNYCSDTPFFRWEKTFLKSDLSRILGYGSIERISVAGRYESGKIKNLKFHLKNGKVLTSSSHSFRMEVNRRAPAIFFTAPDIIPSTNFSVISKGNSFLFSGTGYGHGVGLCQWGARMMAEEYGNNYAEILGFYFKNLEIGFIANLD